MGFTLLRHQAYSQKKTLWNMYLVFSCKGDSGLSFSRPTKCSLVPVSSAGCDSAQLCGTYNLYDVKI